MNLSNGFKEILMKMPSEKRRDYINKIVADTRSNHPLAEHIRAELAEACLELRKEAAE